MKVKNDVSKKWNKRVFLASLIYTLIFFIITFIIPTYSLLDEEHQISRILWNTLTVSPLILILMYIISGTQILLIGKILKHYYKDNIDDFLNLSNVKSRIIVIVLSLLWFVINLGIWNIVNQLKLG